LCQVKLSSLNKKGLQLSRFGDMPLEFVYSEICHYTFFFPCPWTNLQALIFSYGQECPSYISTIHSLTRGSRVSSSSSFPFSPHPFPILPAVPLVHGAVAVVLPLVRHRGLQLWWIVRNQMLVSLRGGGGELGNLKP
jgi:hypothetical protein